MDRNRADARGGRGHELALAGRDRPRPCVLRAALAASPAMIPTTWPSGEPAATTATRVFSTTRARTGPSAIARRYLYDTADHVRLSARWRRAVSRRWPIWWQGSARGDIPRWCTSTPGSAAWPKAGADARGPTPGSPRSTVAGCALDLRAAPRGRPIDRGRRPRRADDGPGDDASGRVCARCSSRSA